MAPSVTFLRASSYPRTLRVLTVLALCALPRGFARAASPGAGTVSPTGAALAWSGTASGTASANEGTCVEGVSCDTFTLTVGGAPADYAGKLVAVTIQWSNSANDYDLYIHKDSNSGPLVGVSADGAPQTSEHSAIDPAATGTGVYTVHVVYFAVTPLVDQYQGSASVQPKPVARTASYVQGGLSFSPSVRLKAPVARRDGEPSSRTDPAGNAYVAGIRGVPAGVDLWYFDLSPSSPTYDPNMRNPIYRGQPDSFTDSESTAVGGDGGGDVDIAVGLPDPATGANNNPPTLAATSLVLANISAQRSTDRGVTFMKNPAGNVTGGVPVDDRQWLAFYGPNTVYLLYRTVAPAVTQIQRSNDGGLTYGPARTAGAIGQVGSIDVDQRDGTVYIAGSTGKVCAGVPSIVGGEPLTYTCTQAASDPGGVAHLFFIVKVAPDGTVYVAYSNDHDIFLAHSTDKGQTWSLPVRVSNGAPTITSVFPHLGTGKPPGSVGLVWYGTSNAVNDDNADWRVFYATSANATAASPTFTQVEAGDHVIHSSNISEGGLTGSANRNLIDYFQVSFDPTGAAVIAYTDDHNDFDGHTYVTRQTGGPGVNGAAVPAPVEGRSLPKATKPPAIPQVTDFAQDVQVGLLGVVPTNDPLDVLSVTWSCEDPFAGTASSNPKLVTRMKVSDLSSLPGAANWRTNFSANAPDSVLSPTGDYSFARSDRGDQFYFRASTDPTQPSTFSFGTAVRNGDGSITYTRQGAADEGLFDSAAGTVTVKVALAKLNALLPAGHAALAPGAVLAGLRGQTFTAGANAKTDIARGGTQYTIACGAPSGGGNTGGPPGKGNGNVVRVTGGGAIDGKRERFDVQASNGFGTSPPAGQVRYRDQGNGFEMVSDTIDTFSQNGSNEVVLTGTGHVGGTAVTFTVRVQDNGEGGTNDFFSIVMPGFPSSQGTLTQGNIQFHF
jgi:hypothetical protein